jgi:hypothetical protein
MLPKDFPPWGTVYYYFARWRVERGQGRDTFAVRTEPPM